MILSTECRMPRSSPRASSRRSTLRPMIAAAIRATMTIAIAAMQDVSVVTGVPDSTISGVRRYWSMVSIMPTP